MKDFMLEVQFLEGAVAVTRHEDGRPVALVDEAYEDHAGDKMAAADLAIERGAKPLTPVWDGEGLPTVGIECEVNYRESWQRCEIIAHFKQRAGMVAAFTVEDFDGAKDLEAFIAGNFRPLRPPEQIEAEEYEADAADLAELMTGHRDRSKDCFLTLAKIVLDAGYRKVEGGAL